MDFPVDGKKLSAFAEGENYARPDDKKPASPDDFPGPGGKEGQNRHGKMQEGQ